MSNSAFEKGDQKKGIKYTNFFYYVKYSAYELFGKRFRWKDCQHIASRMKETSHMIEIDKMANRSRNLEVGVRHLVDKNEAACLSLIKKPTLKQAKNARLEAGYYETITRKNSELTIADLRLMYSVQGVPLEEFYTTTLTTKFRFAENEKTTEMQQVRST